MVTLRFSSAILGEVYLIKRSCHYLWNSKVMPTLASMCYKMSMKGPGTKIGAVYG